MDMGSKLLSSLDKDQATAAKIINGPVLVQSGAGSGKTRLLTHRIAYMLEHGVSPEAIACFTFTNKAATEMKERLATLIDSRIKGMWVGTFHSICARMLRGFGELGLVPKEFTIIDGAESLKIMVNIAKQLETETKPETLLHAVSKSKRKLASIKDLYSGLLSPRWIEELSLAYELYQKELRRIGGLDFDDLITTTINVMENSVVARASIHGRFRCVCVDEYQDTAHAEELLLRKIVELHNNIFVVGDLSQSIYSFRDSDYKLMLDFSKNYKGAKVYALHKNYRSGSRIVNAADSLISRNKSYVNLPSVAEKEGGEVVKAWFESGSDEAEGVADKILSLLDSYKFEEIAVLCRLRVLCFTIEHALLTRNIPYTMSGGANITSKHEVKLLISYLRLILNQNDDLALRKLLLAFGTTSGSVVKLEGYAAAHEVSMFQALSMDRPAWIAETVWGTLVSFKEEIESLIGMAESLSLLSVIDVIMSIRLKDYVVSLDNGPSRLNTISRFIDMLRDYDGECGEALPIILEKVAVSSAFASQEEAPAVKLMTIHQAKGLEFPVVFVVGMEEGLLPHLKSLDSEEAIEEERRLCYVAMTRAVDKLYMSGADSRELYGKMHKSLPSRFLGETHV